VGHKVVALSLQVGLALDLATPSLTASSALKGRASREWTSEFSGSAADVERVLSRVLSSSLHSFRLGIRQCTKLASTLYSSLDCELFAFVVE